MKNAIRFLIGSSVFLALAGILASPAPAHTCAQDSQKPNSPAPSNRAARIITITALDFSFDPVSIHLKVNEKAELDVTARGRPVGIRINPFPDGAKTSTPPGLSFLYGEDCYKLKTNEMVPIQIEATQQGTYTFSCCKGCGSNHKTMQGRIIVDPAP
jgi:heme/copper-type cytochrome/quinol oxidase subunit 2